jgi:cell division protease FtsH
MNPPHVRSSTFTTGQWILEDMTPNDQEGDSTPETDASSRQSDSKESAPKTPMESSGKGNPDSADEPRPGRAFSLMPLIVIGCLLMLVWFLFNSPTSHGTGVPHNFFRSELLAGNVESLTVYHMAHGDVFTGSWVDIPVENPESVTGTLKKDFNVTPLPGWEADDELLAALNRITALKVEHTEMPAGMQVLIWIGMSLMLIAFIWFMFRRSSDPFSGGGMMGSFVRSPARRFEKDEKSAKFDDVAGLKSAKQDLEEVVQFLKTPDDFTRLGARIPRGVLLVGPPGTGKTLLARATAGEADVPFYAVNGSEFIQMFVGVGATRVRDLFKTARANAPCIIFIDEIDAVGRVRGAGVGGGHDEREQTLNQILSEMDGFGQTESIIVLAATNRQDVLDPALLRPGRFDRHVTVDLPVKEGRLGILKVHTRKVPLAEDVRLEALAQSTIGYSGAELQKLVNEAALKAARDGKRRVSMDEFLFAQDLIMMGALREEQLDDSEKKLTAWHEAGHAILAWFQEGMDIVHKVTIIPRGRALGVTQLMPEKEIYNVSESILRKRLVMMLGGRAAEKLVFNEGSAGAENDIERATNLARRMVASWGMSEAIGPVSFKQSDEHPFLGKEMHTYREFSEETARIIDIEVQKIMQSSHERATQLLTEKRSELDALANALLEHEYLERKELKELLGPRPGETLEPQPAETEEEIASSDPTDGEIK